MPGDWGDWGNWGDWGDWSNWGNWGRVEVVSGLVEVILGTMKVILGRMRSRVVGLFRRKLGFTLIPYISNISRVFISNRISDNLGTSIRKIYTILTSSLLTITNFILSKV